APVRRGIPTIRQSLRSGARMPDLPRMPRRIRHARTLGRSECRILRESRGKFVNGAWRLGD
ncbi:MAG TPA: hypothetical protein VJ957_09605, partial [Longimicrobiales bacterium]|nr:hypothetical protein [Longimicrobiales bacterium]